MRWLTGSEFRSPLRRCDSRTSKRVAGASRLCRLRMAESEDMLNRLEGQQEAVEDVVWPAPQLDGCLGLRSTERWGLLVVDVPTASVCMSLHVFRPT